MAYEFKKLSDVEVVAEPAESANVLIEEDGVIKKAPKTAVGGAGGGTDAVIECNGSDLADKSLYVLPDNLIDVIDAKFASGEMPTIDIKSVGYYSGGTIVDRYYRCYSVEGGTSGYTLLFAYSYYNHILLSIDRTNTVSYIGCYNLQYQTS